MFLRNQVKHPYAMNNTLKLRNIQYFIVITGLSFSDA
ncbi:hypothetical protein SAMN05192529_10811 [Arachidicoccus rhizosphaerae]|uniref:Uncharacterized protein n=1 Tax=Arachidicoccus rhizosphaerae TaxID=551991 RepID=A0A1H3YCX1_9BACT|nr:hypothetical protein SAMN05192529_10811 [Arachidicoccus rhizosphaerae]